MEYILIIIILIVVSVMIGVYNPIKQFQSKAKEALQELEAQLKNRAQLLTPFITQVKTSNPALADKLEQALKDQKELEISALLPEALVNQNTSEAGALKEVEKQIQDSIRYLDSTVTDYNAQLDGQVAKYIAGPLGLTKMVPFGTAATAAPATSAPADAVAPAAPTVTVQQTPPAPAPVPTPTPAPTPEPTVPPQTPTATAAQAAAVAPVTPVAPAAPATTIQQTPTPPTA